MLRWSSLLFATVVAHAYHARSAAHHHLFLAVTALSLLHHGGACAAPPSQASILVAWADRAVAHAAFAYVVLVDLRLGAPMMMMADARLFGAVGAACAVVAALWAAEHSPRAQRLLGLSADALHACLHAVSVAGLHALLLGAAEEGAA